MAGAHLGGLLFFLNPELPFRIAPIARGVLAYGALLAGVSLLLHLPLLSRPIGRTARFLPWSLATVLLAFAVLDAGQASFYAYYLPAGINVRLLKAAVWLALAGLLTLATAMAHGWTRRSYSARSRWTVALLSALSLFAVLERREAYQPRPDPTPLAAVVEGQRQLDLFVVGIDGATLDALLPLAEQGRLPFFAAALREGSHARLRSITPTRAQPLWATLATGKYPHRHGVRGNELMPAQFLAPGAELHLVPAGIGFSRWGLFGASPRQVGRAERKALALWEILAQLGVHPGVVGWPEATPAAAGTSFAISEAFFAGTASEIAPPDLQARAGALRLRPQDVPESLLASFGSPPPRAVPTALAQDLWREHVTAALLEQYPDTHALFVRLPGLRQVERRWFGGYVAHDLEGAQTERAATAARLVDAYYRHLDDALASLWARARGERLFAIVSPYGAAAPSGWRRVASLGRVPLEGVLSGRADGILIVRGEGVHPGGFTGEAGIEDVVPTLLYGLGLPVGRDMDGRALTGVFEPTFRSNHSVGFVPSYEVLTF